MLWEEWCGKQKHSHCEQVMSVTIGNTTTMENKNLFLELIFYVLECFNLKLIIQLYNIDNPSTAWKGPFCIMNTYFYFKYFELWFNIRLSILCCYLLCLTCFYLICSCVIQLFCHYFFSFYSLYSGMNVPSCFIERIMCHSAKSSWPRQTPSQSSKFCPTLIWFTE